MLVRNFVAQETQSSTASTLGPFTMDCLTNRDVTSLVRSSVKQRTQLDIAICNAHTILSAVDDPAYALTLKKMTLLNDGIGVNLASLFLRGYTFPENLNGTDLVPRILSDIRAPMRIFLLGAGDEQVLGAKDHIEKKYPMHEIVGYRNGYFDEEEAVSICDSINKTKPDLLLVAMGNPRQEVFVTKFRSQLNVPVTIGVGALFDFMSGSVARAPKIMQSLCLEWLFRLLQEPRRLFRRYVIGIPRFIFALGKLKHYEEELKSM